MKNETITYNTASNEIGYFTTDNCWIPYTPNTFWVSYPTYTYTEDRVTKAFRIIEILMKLKIIKGIGINKFIELVNLISKEI